MSNAVNESDKIEGSQILRDCIVGEFNSITKSINGIVKLPGLQCSARPRRSDQLSFSESLGPKKNFPILLFCAEV
jgi:hypothetical protein